MQNFDYSFNINGNYMPNIKGMNEATSQFATKTKEATGFVTAFANKLAVFDLATGFVEKLSNTINGLSQGGIQLDSQMHDLSAVAGVTGDGLKQIEQYARQSAKAFGTDASQAVVGYKLLLSQLSPELGKYPKALQAMGNSIQTTSKLMGNDGVAAAEVLTTAMNQYGVSLDDPMQASREMARMMNVMAAAGQAGSAELPAIKVALEQCGMAAKAANVSFEETNAAIQVLDKAGKKGSEGGVALRNTLSVLAQGRFLPKDTKEELQRAGIDVIKLSDTSMSLHDRLQMLKPVLNDAALFGKLFGRENASAARALVQGTDALKDFTDAVTGTNSAEEQAAIVMDSFAERQARAQQKIEDFKISLFEATNGLTFYIGKAAEVLVPVGQMIPLFQAMGSGMAWIKGLQWGAMWARIQSFVYASRLQMAFMNKELVTGQFVSNGFFINITRATLAVLRFGTVGLLQGLKALGAFALSLVTTGTASTAFAATASTAFGAFKLSAVTACRAVSVAIMNIPIVGWIAAAIAAIVAIGVYFWKTSATFRAVLKGIWAAFKATFKGIADLAKGTFSAIGDLLKAAFSLSPSGMKAALGKLKQTYSDFGSQIGKAYTDAYNKEIADSEKAKKKEKAPAKPKAKTPTAGAGLPELTAPTTTVDPTVGTTSGKGSGSSSESKIRNINIHVDKLIEQFTIQTTNLHESAERVKEAVGQALLSALNDVNLAY